MHGQKNIKLFLVLSTGKLYAILYYDWRSITVNLGLVLPHVEVQKAYNYSRH